MGASKTVQYSGDELWAAKYAHALGHPARIRIIKTLLTHRFCRNKELIGILELDKRTVHEHVQVLEDAYLLRKIFFQNGYVLELTKEHRECILSPIEFLFGEL